MRGAGRLRVLCRRSAHRPWRTCRRRCDRLCCSNLPERDSLRAGAHFSPGTDRQRHRRENLHRYQWKKNLIGTFYQPKAVYVDPAMVRTLPARFFHNGLGEAIKIGCVADKDLFEIFEKPPLTRISFVFFRKSSAAALPSRHTMWKSIPKTKASAVSLISATHWAARQRDTTVSMISA